MLTVTQVNTLIDADTTGTVTLNDGVLIGDLDFLNLRNKTIEIVADPAITIQGQHWTIIGGKLRAMSGVLFECISSNAGLMANVWATGLLRSKELFRCLGTNGCYDTTVIGGEWAKPADMLSPIVRVEVSGPFYNRNKWNSIRFQTNGRPQAPVVKLTCTNSANWIYGNSVSDINFEIPNAGAVHLESCFGTELSGMNMFDCNLFGPITDDLIRVGKYATGLKSKMTTIRHYLRLSGALNEGIVDINAVDAGNYQPSLIVDMVDGIAGAGLKVKLPEWVNQRAVQAQYVW